MLVTEVIVIVVNILIGLLGWLASNWVRAELKKLEAADSAISSRLESGMMRLSGSITESQARLGSIEEGAVDRRIRIATLEAHYTDMSRRLDELRVQNNEIISLLRGKMMGDS